MGKLLMLTSRKTKTHRDDELREAHQRAFDEILQARDAADYRARTREAVSELIDACERYCEEHSRS